METIYQWLQSHVALFTWPIAFCVILTFVFNFVLKKGKTKDKPSKIYQKCIILQSIW